VKQRYRSLRRTAAPAVEPVTLAEAKAHCRVDASADDTLIQNLVTTARELVEDYIDRALVTQRLVMKIDEFGSEIELPRPPMASSGTVTAVTITYTIADGSTTTLAASEYRVDRDAQPGRIRTLYNGSWPSGLLDANAVTVTWWAGYGAATDVPQRVRSAMLMTILELYEKRSDGQMPEGAKRLLDTVSWGSYT
jgi:uncharacterized phiE125 gp8 family phage protein